MEKKEEQPAAPVSEAVAAPVAAPIAEPVAAPVAAPAQKMEDVKVFDQGMSISGLVKKELVDMLIACGFSKTVSEKALYLTGGTSTDKAMDWVEQHQLDKDFEEELRIVGQKEEPPKSALSEEEARRKARELQEQIRKKQKEREEKNEREREQERLKGTKAMAEAKERLEEASIIREADKRRKEKLETVRAMKQMEEQLRRDKEEKFGKKFSASGKPLDSGKEEKKPIEKAQNAVKIIKELYPEDNHPDVAHNCFAMLKAYLGNLLKDPTNEKFKKVNKQNAMFKERVGSVQGGILFLKAVGFEDKATTLEISAVDQSVIKAALELLG